jgi:hypothetical protein
MKTISVFCLVLVLCFHKAGCQTLESFKGYWNGVIKVSSIEDIKTKNDFDQSMLSVDEIDGKINELMTISDIAEFEMPVNLKKLNYVGRKNPKEVIAFYTPFFERDMPMINQEVEIFNYDGIWILVNDLSARNYLNVFFSARAFQILKYRYPELHNYLIMPNQIELGYKKLGPGEFLPTLNKLVPILSFDKSPSKIAGSLWNHVFAQEATVEYNGHKNYENTLNALTSINYETSRPKEIYKSEDELENYWRYLKEGLIESIGHEYTHHYITNFKNFDKKGRYIYDKRYDDNDNMFSFDVEEAIVINTIETYFMQKGGLSKDLVDFNMKVKYKAKKDVLEDLTKEINKQRFDTLKNLSPPASITFDDVYRLAFL